MNFSLTEEQLLVRDMARRFAETEIKPRAAEFDQTHEHPAEIIRQLGELKMLGVAVPEAVSYTHLTLPTKRIV